MTCPVCDAEQISCEVFQEEFDTLIYQCAYCGYEWFGDMEDEDDSDPT